MGDKGRDGALRRPRPKRAQRLPAALPPGTARRTVPTSMISGGFTAGNPAVREGAPYLPAGFRRLYRRGSRSAGQRTVPTGRIPAALPPGTAQRAVPTWFKQRKHRLYRDWNGHVERQIEDS